MEYVNLCVMKNSIEYCKNITCKRHYVRETQCCKANAKETKMQKDGFQNKTKKRIQQCNNWPARFKRSQTKHCSGKQGRALEMVLRLLDYPAITVVVKMLLLHRKHETDEPHILKV